MKYLVLLAVVAIVYAFLRSQQRRPPPPGRGASSLPAPEEMVRCAHCGVHLPHSQALHDEGGRSYCCRAHQRP